MGGKGESERPVGVGRLDRQADRQKDQGKGKRQEGQEKQERQESELCLTDTVKKSTCHITDSGKDLETDDDALASAPEAK